MRKISRIIRVEKWQKDGKTHYRTHAIADGDEVAGYGKDFKVGDLVECWFDAQWGIAKMQKPKV